jgi:hypothetical protein
VVPAVRPENVVDATRVTGAAVGPDVASALPFPVPLRYGAGAMRIESFWAKGFRSLRDVRLDGLGAFNVFYGPNGGGKSNILEAIRVLLEICRLEQHLHTPGEACRDLRDGIIKAGVARHRDLYARDDVRTIVLGARFIGPGLGSSVASGGFELEDLTVEYTFDWIVQRDPKVFLSRLESNGQDVTKSVSSAQRSYLRALISETLPAQAYTLVNAVRELGPDESSLPGVSINDMAWHQREGGLARLLFDTSVDSRPAFRHRFEELRALLKGPPLNRPPFFPVKDAMTGRIEIHERLSEPNPEGLEIPIDLAGLGMAQIYVILAQAMLSGARAVGIEEPEAHLHAPTTGRHLRELLKRLVDEKHIDQLFIATHSNLFDLDPTGYFDVSLQNGETVVTKKPLDAIDQHLYEPGPAKHALQRMLQHMPPDEIMFRRADGSPVSAAEMLDLLREDDPLAVDFLRDVHGAAVTIVKVKSKKGK